MSRKNIFNTKKSLNDVYFKNEKKTVKGFDLSITSHGTVYYDGGKGFIKLNSVYSPKDSRLNIQLPNGKNLMLYLTIKGLKTKEEYLQLKENYRMDKKLSVRFVSAIINFFIDTFCYIKNIFRGNKCSTIN